jgi:hypothetical protein
MGFQFSETMAGTLELDGEPGRKRPMKFDIVTEAASTRDYLRDQKAIMRGVIHAAPLAQSADLEGVMTIRPFGQRIIRYELAFIGDDGRSYELVGQKDIRWTAPIRTFTYLPADILDDQHRRIATCETYFDVRHWWSFLRSWRPLRSVPPVAARAGS